MLLLCTQAVPQMREYAHPNLGRLLTPRHYSSIAATILDRHPWAVDNDGFQGVDHAAWDRLLDRIVSAHTGLVDGRRSSEDWLNPPLFVVVPDIVADAAATLSQWARWAPAVRRRGLPLAWVAQNDAELGLIPYTHEFDALFIGGDTAWKLGPAAERLVRAAKRAGKHVHMGRVNSYARLRYAASIGCDSVDGTGWMRWRRAHLRNGLAAIAQPPQPPLFTIS